MNSCFYRSLQNQESIKIHTEFNELQARCFCIGYIAVMIMFPLWLIGGDMTSKLSSISMFNELFPALKNDQGRHIVTEISQQQPLLESDLLS